jgi:hypothetical protein
MVLAAGCSGLKPYHTHGQDNLVILTSTDSGSVFTGIKVAVDIHHVDSDCNTEYQGTIKLDRPRLSTGIHTNVPVRLIFVFESNTWLAGASSRISYDTLLDARPGYRYEAKVSYRDNFYDVALTAYPPHSAPVKHIQKTPLSACVIAAKQ